jgi:hypothetical protein
MSLCDLQDPPVCWDEVVGEGIQHWKKKILKASIHRRLCITSGEVRMLLSIIIIRCLMRFSFCRRLSGKSDCELWARVGLRGLRVMSVSVVFGVLILRFWFRVLGLCFLV